MLYFGIIGFAYKRFMYCGTAREWVNDIPYPVMDFLNSRVRRIVCTALSSLFCDDY